MKLSERLRTIASLVPKGATVADIGTDHAYLPVWLCEKGICPFAVASDVMAGPLASARTHVARAGLNGRIDCRLADGLQGLDGGETTGALICGMGGKRIIHILESSPAVRDSLQFIILQPQSDSAALREYVVRQGFYIEEERLVKEDGRLYQIMKICKGKREVMEKWQLETGPRNWEKKDPLLIELIEDVIRKKTEIYKGLMHSRTGEAELTDRLAKELKEWEERKWQCTLKR